METKRITVTDSDRIKEEELEEAARILREGGLVAFPTETVYGLGANALDEEAAKKIYAAKGRPSDNPLIAHISSPEELKPLAAEIPDMAKKLMDCYWPGPMTLVFKKTDLVPYGTTGGLDTVAVRMPSDPVAKTPDSPGRSAHRGPQRKQFRTSKPDDGGSRMAGYGRKD